MRRNARDQRLSVRHEVQERLAPSHLEDLDVGALPSALGNPDVLRPDADLELATAELGSGREKERPGPKLVALEPSGEDVHRRAPDEARDEAVRRPLVDLVGSRELLELTLAEDC